MKYNVVILLVLLTTLSACGGGSGENSTTPTPKPPNADPDTAPDPPSDPTPAPAPDEPPAQATDTPNFERGSLGLDDSVPAINCDIRVSTLTALENAASQAMTPGVTLCLQDGEYFGLDLNYGGGGTEENPITIAAENPGKVVIGGEVQIRMSGSYIVLQGLIFKDGQSQSSDFLQTRGNDRTPCNYCRITEIAIIDFDKDNDDSGKWLNIYGHHNRVDHSWFTGKSNDGALLIINREVGEGEIAADTEIDYARIDHNYFGDRPPRGGKAYAASSDNGLEAIRVGTSDSHSADSFTVVEHNYFERIQGEAEVISNKSGHNTYYNNTIRDSYGSLTTRHGSSATISHNYILGDDHPYAGGIRIIDDGHTIANNYIEGVRYKNTRFHGGIVIHNSDGSTSNGYQQLENVLIAHNTVIDSVNSLNVNGGNQSRNPRNVLLINNIIFDAIGPIITQAQEGVPDDSVIAGNYFSGQSFSDSSELISHPGISYIDAQLVADSRGISRPSATSPTLDAVTDVDTGNFPPIEDDMDGQRRTSTNTSGADQNASSAPSIGLLNSYDVGPMSYRPPQSRLGVTKVEIKNHDFDNGSDHWTLSNALISTAESETFSRGASAKISAETGRIHQQVTLEENARYTLSAFVRGASALGVEIGDFVESVDRNSDGDFSLSLLSFQTGDDTSAIIFGALDGAVSNSVHIDDHDFDDFDGQDLNDDGIDDGSGAWAINEGRDIGQVQSSSNSADGSVKFKYNDINEEGGSPSISQAIDGILPNTEYTLSMYVLEKNSSPVTLTLGVYTRDGATILASKTVNYSLLKQNEAPKGDDGFLQDRLIFNSGNNNAVTIFVEYAPNTIISDGGDSGQTEVRVDEFSLSYEGPPGEDAEAIFDSIRLVKHPQE